MLKFAKILVPLDLHDNSFNVLYQAAGLARHFQSEIVVVHVRMAMSHSDRTLDENPLLAGQVLIAELTKRAQGEKGDALRANLDGLPVKLVTFSGDPANEIVRTADDEKADLIMMATHGYGGFERFLLGSITAKVLHKTKCPVWTGAHLEPISAREFAIRHIICAVDLSAHSRSTLDWAQRMASEFGARLTIAHATPSVEIYGPGGNYVLPEWKDALVGGATEKIAKLQREMNLKAEVFIGSGDPARTVNEAAKQVGADLLIVGSHPSDGRLRSNGYAIIRESYIPILNV